MAENKMQVVEDDEIENVGIMSGFMDGLEEVLREIDAEMSGAPNGDEDMAAMLGRRPDSPEILMNNLRGDYRSIDARREELADLVGYSAAAETPDEVLAMLQPVLARQGVASLPMGAADVGALPMDPLTGMPPQGGAQPPMDPTMMGMPPPTDPAVMQMPPPSGPGDMMPPPPQAPVGMKEGGIVQFFQEGSGPGGVTFAEEEDTPFAPEVIDRAIAIASQRLMNPPVPGELPDVGARTRELAPMYAEILGTQDKDAMRASMLFDIAQAALGYAGNVGPQGQPLRGSQAARLAGATVALPGQIGARATAARTAETQARLAALQQAQGERAAVMESNLAQEKDYNELLMKIAGQKRPPRLLSEEEARDLGLEEGLRWQEGPQGYTIAGGRPPVPLVNMGENTLERVGNQMLAERLIEQYDAAQAASSNIQKIDETLRLLEEGDVDTGFGAEFRQNIRRIQNLFSADPDRVRTLSDTELLNSVLGADVFGAIKALGIGARGLDTPAEREFLREVVAGTITLDKNTLLRMTGIRRKAEENAIRDWNETLASGRADRLINIAGGMIPTAPLPVPAPFTAQRRPAAIPPVDPAAIQAELQRRAGGGN